VPVPIVLATIYPHADRPPPGPSVPPAVFATVVRNRRLEPLV
jgi:hypothetical protein